MTYEAFIFQLKLVRVMCDRDISLDTRDVLMNSLSFFHHMS